MRTRLWNQIVVNPSTTSECIQQMLSRSRQVPLLVKINLGDSMRGTAATVGFRRAASYLQPQFSSLCFNPTAAVRYYRGCCTFIVRDFSGEQSPIQGLIRQDPCAEGPTPP